MVLPDPVHPTRSGTLSTPAQTCGQLLDGLAGRRRAERGDDLEKRGLLREEYK